MTGPPASGPNTLAFDGPDSMGRETAEGPAAVEATLLGMADGSAARLVAGARRVLLIGTGASLAMAEAAAPLFVRPAAIVREASSLAFGDVDGRPIEPGDVVVAVSMSGRSPETRAATLAARRAGVPLVAVTARADSPLAGAVDEVVLTPVGVETGAATKSELSAFAALAALAAALPMQSTEVRRLRDRLQASAADLDTMMGAGAIVARSRGCWALGFGPALGVARATALLLHEKARRPTVFCTPSEFRHGPIEASGVEDAVILVDAGLAPNDDRSRYLDRLARELAELGVALIAVGGTGPGALADAAGASPAEAILHALLRVQQLARISAVSRGTYREDFLVLRGAVVGAADDMLPAGDREKPPSSTDGA